MKCVALLAPAGSSGPLLLRIPTGALNRRMGGHRRRAIERLEIQELGVVHDARQHLAQSGGLARRAARNRAVLSGEPVSPP